MEIKTRYIVLVFLFFSGISISFIYHNITSTNYRESSIQKIKSLDSSNITSIEVIQKNKIEKFIISDTLIINNFISKLKTIKDNSANFGKIGAGEKKYIVNVYSFDSLLLKTTLLLRDSKAAIFINLDNKTNPEIDNIIPQKGLNEEFNALIKTMPKNL